MFTHDPEDRGPHFDNRDKDSVSLTSIGSHYEMLVSGGRENMERLARIIDKLKGEELKKVQAGGPTGPALRPEAVGMLDGLANLNKAHAHNVEITMLMIEQLESLI
jgi:hypothetical protein